MAKQKKAKKEKLTKEQIYQELSEDVINFFKERLDNFYIPMDLKFYFQANSKQKQLIKMSRIPDQYSVILKKDILVQVNEEYYDSFSSNDNDINTILFDQCINLIHCNLEKGTFKFQATDFKASEGIIEKYTYDKVQRAIEIERLYESQKTDQQN